MPRYSKVVQPEMLHNRETYFKESVNKSLTTEHCQFFLKKHGSEKVFQHYLMKYYPQNSGCAYQEEIPSKSLRFPQLVYDKSKEQQSKAHTQIQKDKQIRLKSLYAAKQRSPAKYRNRGEVQNYELKLNTIIKKIKAEYRSISSFSLH